METEQSQAGSVATATSQVSEASTGRLVIRVEIIPEAPLPPTVSQRLNRRTLALTLGAVAVLMLTWIGISVFRNDPTPAAAVSEGPSKAESQPLAHAPTPNEASPVRSNEPPAKLARSETESANTTSVEPRVSETTSLASQVQEPPEASPSPIDEVIPDVPQSALQTIRGTVRVVIRVIIDKEGTVLAATPDVPGPSRYFERLSLEAAWKWTFTPSDTQEQRIMVVGFNYTREGTSARASPPQ